MISKNRFYHESNPIKKKEKQTLLVTQKERVLIFLKHYYNLITKTK